MPTKLVIYGASNPCVLKLLDAINRNAPTWDLIGFIDDTPEKAGGSFYSHPILGPRDALAQFEKSEIRFFNNVFGSMSARRRVAGVLQNFGCEMITLVHPGVDMGFCQVGADVAIEQHAVLDMDVSIGDHSCVKRNSSLGHETVVEEFAFVGPGATVCGRVRIGEGVYVGAGSCIRDGVEIGKNSVVGAGSVVVKDVPAGVTVVGNPAKQFKRSS